MPELRTCSSIAVVLTTILCVQAAAQPLCGDCNGDMNVNIVDALTAAQHTVQLIMVVPPNFDACNVVGDLGGPTAPGNPVVNVLDAMTIAHFDAGLTGPLNCVASPVIGPGPYDVVFTTIPTDVSSDVPFEVTVGLFVQGTPVRAIPSVPVEVTLSVETGNGTLTGSPRQWMTSETQVFGGLRYGPVESFTLRASAGMPHTDDISGSIACAVAVELDHPGRIETGLGPFPAPVRFHFRDDGLSVAVGSGTFSWEIIQDSTSMVVDSGSVALSGQSLIDVSVPVLPAQGLYRVRGEILGTTSNASYALMLGDSAAQYMATIATGRVDVAYADSITDYVPGSFNDFFALADQLPPGLILNPGGGGMISGTPTQPGNYRFDVFGVSGVADVTRIPVALAVFSFRDSEIESGVDFSAMGPLAISEFDLFYSFTNSWDCTTDTTTSRFYYPTNIQNMRRLPAICFIHGNGFRFDHYDNIMRVIASHGYIVGSCDNAGYPSGTCVFCGGGGSSIYGFARATGFQNSILEKFQEFDAMPGHALENHVDFDNIAWSGHSRGGSTTLLNIVLAPDKVRGAIPIMQVDPLGQSCLQPTYIGFTFSPVPTMSFSAERDGDVIFPIAENPMEDAILSGADTHVTIYGANHNHTGDSNGGEAFSTITRTEQHERVRHWMTIFMQRHTKGDLRVESQLYLDEHTSSMFWGAFGRRNMDGAITIDEHQATGPTTNDLGGDNSASVISILEARTYPSSWSSGRTTIHRRFAFGSGGGTNTWSAPMGNPIDTSSLTRLSWRGRQYNSTSTGYSGTGDWQSWLTGWDVTLTDGTGQMATLDIEPIFPISGTASTIQQRFHRFSLTFDDFVLANPSFDPTSIESVTFSVTPSSPTGSRWVSVDSVRFE